MQEISDILSPGKKLSTDGAFCRRGAWRTLGRRGVAIRFPAEKPGKLAPLRANSQPLSYSPKVLLSAMPCRKENGLPRRFAPRNDMQKLAGCLRVQERAAMANSQLFRICPKYCSSLCTAARRTDCHVASLLAMTVGEVLAPVDTPCLLHTLRAPRPCTRAHVPAFCMSLRTSAHTGVAIRNLAGSPDKLASVWANSQPSTNSP